MLKGNGDNNLFVSFERVGIEIYKIFISVLLRDIYSHLNQRTVRHLGLAFNLIIYVSDFSLS